MYFYRSLNNLACKVFNFKLNDKWPATDYNEEERGDALQDCIPPSLSLIKLRSKENSV